jgi:hypothetical protein
MSTGPVATAHRLLTEAVEALRAAAESGITDQELLSTLTVCEGMTRRLDQVVVTTVATLDRRGAFAERGYKSPTPRRSCRRGGTALVEALDQDGAAPDDRMPTLVNELRLTRNPNGAGGKLKGRFDDAAMFDAIAAVIDAKAKPLTGDDQRSARNGRPKPSPTSAGTCSTTATSPHAAVGDPTSTCWSGSKIWRTAAGLPCSTSAVPSPPSPCACSPAVLVRSPPHQAMGGRRRNRPAQLRDGVQGPPPPAAPLRMDRPHPRGAPGVRPADLDRPRSNTPAKTTASPPRERHFSR